ncbi:MAG: DUF2227 family putative metal-binding protein [Aquificaceae bacterium]
MALGKGHDFANLLALPLCLYYMPREFYLPFTAGYLVGTFLLSPDLDLPHSKPSKRWRAFRLFWRPYQHLSKHRGLSHIPLLGTFVRLGYFTLLFLFLYFVLLGIFQRYASGLKELLLLFDPFDFLSSLAEKEWVFYFALGVIVSELFHVALDLLTSFFKGRSRRRK